jgi:hypothetical protein
LSLSLSLVWFPDWRCLPATPDNAAELVRHARLRGRWRASRGEAIEIVAGNAILENIAKVKSRRLAVWQPHARMIADDRRCERDEMVEQPTVPTMAAHRAGRGSTAVDD